MFRAFFYGVGILVGKWLVIVIDPTDARIEYAAHLTFDFILFCASIALFEKLVMSKLDNK